MAVFDATSEGYELCELDGKPVAFTNMRLDRQTVPDGLCCYDIRDSDKGTALHRHPARHSGAEPNPRHAGGRRGAPWKLLQGYRDAVWNLELAVRQVKIGFEAEFGESIEDFLDSLYLAGADFSGTEIESHARSIERSRKMLSILDSAVELLRSKHKNGEAFYWILYYSFLSPQELESVEDVLEKLRPISTTSPTAPTTAGVKRPLMP